MLFRSRRASGELPTCMFLSGSHPCVRRGYTLPQSIKGEKKDEERVGISNSQKREGWKTVSEEEKAREKVSEGLGFLVFQSV